MHADAALAAGIARSRLILSIQRASDPRPGGYDEISYAEIPGKGLVILPGRAVGY